MTMPIVSTDGTKAYNSIDISSWGISKCIKLDGMFFKDNTTNAMPVNTMVWGSNNTNIYGVRCYLSTSSLLSLESSYSTYNGRTAYITLQYTKA